MTAPASPRPSSSLPTIPGLLSAPSGRGAALRAAVEDSTIAIVGAPWALAAKLVEREGFAAIYLSGAAFSAGGLGIPDIGLFTLDQLVEQTRLLARSVTIPLVVDADTGFGGPQEVAECVRTLEAAGAAAIQLEDQQSDKRCGQLAGKQLISEAQMCEKIAAAAAARRDPSTVIIGRTDARGVTNLDDCVRRLHAYRDAGADWLFPEALQTRDEFAQIGREFAASKTPLLANMTEFGVSPLIPLEDLSELGFSAALHPVTLLRIAMKAIEAGLGMIADEGTQENLLDLMQTREELYDLLDYAPAKPEAWLAKYTEDRPT
ncbi:MAG: isocitrate lyase/phosphoenolpyruvate mutase family protein [Planctomycetota bacterium]